MNLNASAGNPPGNHSELSAHSPAESQLLPGRFSQILFISGLTVYLFFSFFNISNPGMEYDESLFFAKAITDIQNRTIPLVLNCYLGALKEIIWIPVALLSTPSEYSLRIPSVLIGFLCLLMFHAFLRNAFGSRIANISIFFLGIDPNFIFQIKYDTAPISLALFLGSALLYTSVRFYKTRSRKYLYLSFFIFGLGVYDKVTFLNFALILLLPLILVYFQDMKPLLRGVSGKYARTLLIGSLCFCGGAFPLLYTNIFISPLCTIKQVLGRSGDFEARSSLTWPEKVRYKTGLIANSLSGDLFLKEIVSGATIYSAEYYDRFTYSHDHGSTMPAFLRALDLQKGNALPCLTLYAFISSLVMYIIRCKPFYLYVVFSMLVWYLSSIALSGVVYSFHILSIYPMLVAYIVIMVTDVGEAMKRIAGRRLFLYGMFAAMFWSAIGQDVAYAHSIYVGDSKGMWSKAINELSSEVVTRYKDKTIYALDWGMRPQLIILTGNRLKLRASLDERERRNLDKIIEGGKSIFITHTPKYSKFVAIREDFFKLLKERGLGINLLAEIKQENGEVLFEIYGKQ